jgi:hypothetical protein
VTPFEHEGKQAVRAHVWVCGGKPFVSHLERYTTEYGAALRAAQTGQTKPETLAVIQGSADMLEVKRPREGNWVKLSDPRARDIITPRCPAGSTDRPRPYLPK